MPTARDPTSDELDCYRAVLRRQQRADEHARVRREQQAWELARQAAALLRQQFHAERVVVFGSLVHPGCFTRWSDVDVAATGLAPRDTLRAMEAVRDLSTEIPVNLVDLAACRDSLRRVVEQEGRPV